MGPRFVVQRNSQNLDQRRNLSAFRPTLSPSMTALKRSSTWSRLRPVRDSHELKVRRSRRMIQIDSKQPLDDRGRTNPVVYRCHLFVGMFLEHSDSSVVPLVYLPVS